MNRVQAASSVERHRRREDPFWIGCAYGAVLGACLGAVFTAWAFFRVIP